MPQYIPLNAVFKKIFSALLLVLLLQGLFAQTKYGITAGAGKAALYKFPFSPEDYNRYSSTTSLWAGVTIDVPLIQNSLHLFTTAVYSQKGYTYLMQRQTGYTNTSKDSSFAQHLNYADLNFSLRKKFVFGENNSNSFFAGTGPVINFLTGGKEQIQANYFGNLLPEVNNTNTKLATGNGAGKYKPVFFSWNFAAGFEFSNFSVWVNTNLPLADYYQDAQNAVKHKVKTFGINAGYTLFTHHKKDKSEKRPKAAARDIPVVKDTLTDSDGDGIIDIHDKCPGHKGTAKYFGCPVPDTDGDGINDDEDKCITIAGTAANNGCPAFTDTVKPTQKDTTCFTVYFEPGKSILRTEAYKTLDIVIKQLKANPKLVAVFTGHTDNVGSVEANYNRSIGRATVCADHVASYYINKKRFTIISLGNTKPAADLNDPLVQWKNRRVEICLFESKE